MLKIFLNTHTYRQMENYDIQLETYLGLYNSSPKIQRPKNFMADFSYETENRLPTGRVDFRSYAPTSEHSAHEWPFPSP